MRWLWVLLTTGCVASNAVVCDDGLTCPAGTTCRQLTDPAGELCATPAELAACDGKAQLDPCQLDGVAMARCYDGVCLAAGCGNGRLDPAEVCDDGNTASGDGCSADCRSNETCGNGIVDPVNGEVCDDGNLLDHDGCSSTCQPEQLRWSERSLLGPGTRYQGAAAYDPLRGRVVVFGGLSDFSGTIVGETWEWNGADWERSAAGGPSARTWTAMAFDGQRIVLFGGLASSFFGDTWTYDGSSWVPHAVAGPQARYLHTMAYDTRRKRVVLYGGIAADGITMLTDTWEWDGTAWAKISTAHAPGVRAGAAMAYDPVRGRVVLVGGTPQSGAAKTWVYDGIDWTDVTPATGAVPEPFQAGMGFDTASGRLIAFGGCSALSCSSPSPRRTLAWDGTSWVDLGLTTAPPDRDYPQVASTGDRVIVFGGAAAYPTMYGDTWIFEAGAWQAPTLPPARAEAGIASDLVRDRVVVFGGVDNSSPYRNDTWLLSPRGWTQYTGSSRPDPRYFAAMTYDAAARNVVLFGGGTLAGPVADTWIWNGTAWEQRMPAMSPPARIRAAIAFDGHHVTLFGGGGAGVANETWSWDGAGWSHVTPAHSPSARIGACAGFDPVHQVLVMFGGSSSGNLLDETWTYDGTDWTMHDVPVRPAARAGAALAWNPARQRLILSGGTGDLDLWEWDGDRWAPLAAAGGPPPRDAFAAATSIAGTGTMIHGGFSPTKTFGDVWELRWDGVRGGERCVGDDRDGDGLVGCADPDCWSVCTPQCPPGTSCPSTAPRCGDGVCDPAYESCRTCAADCACTPVCGDVSCDAGETAASCPGDCG